MRFQTRSRHVIDLIFPIALFFVFAASSLVVLILAANIYNSTTNQIQVNDQNRTSLSYITQKIRQNDVNGNLSISEVDGVDCLLLTSTFNDSDYTTYIYEYEGMVKEIFIKDGLTFSLKDGKDILQISTLTMEETTDHLFHFTSTDKNGRTDSVVLSERSVQ